MRNKNVILLMVFFAAGSLTGCGKKNEVSDSLYLGEMANDPKLAEKNITNLVKADGLQVAFDLMTMPYHVQMMKLMRADMKYVEGATHGLMVTVMDDKTKKVLENVKIKLAITNPDGKITKHEPEIMHGSGMHHYAIHLKAGELGMYEINARIDFNGRIVSAKTIFDLKK